ncbi:hypothetical protein O181_106090 [Austropuccinia psidii MF-1]|uniref:Uncharacterized protein n=1 Tax=Austropuccinia psidii MF-1 TaxID=1389203 RepID=A0A9Q3PMB8_9BASI|nr:hypothetical protein [Austropuccinia psidii MF-1]
MDDLISYTKRPVNGAWTNFKASLVDARIVDAPFLAEELLQTLNHLSPRSDQALVAVLEFFQKISDSTTPTALFPHDHPDRSKVTPDSSGLRYVFNRLLGTVTTPLYSHV